MGVSPGLDWPIALQENLKLIAQLHELTLSFLLPNMAYQLPKPQLNMWGECGKNPQPATDEGAGPPTKLFTKNLI